MNINRRLVLGGGAAAIALSGETASAATRSSGGGRAHRTALSALARYVEQHRADWGLPGMTVCVVDRDGFAGFITSGYANVERRTSVGPDHLFQIGSISKVFTALTLYSLHQDGKLPPSMRTADALGDIRIDNGGAVTLQHLLNHTSGLPANAPVLAEGGLWSAYDPGAHWYYSNTGYELLSRAIAQADRKLFHQAVEARVLAPLGMTNSRAAITSGDRTRHAQGYEVLRSDRPAFRPGPIAPSPWVNVESGAGSVTSTASDMAIFLRFLLGLAEGRGGPVLSDANAAAFMADPADAPGWAEKAKYGNGLARLVIGERAYLHHTGGMVSFSSAMHLDPEAGVAAFASSNIGFSLNYRPRDVTLCACNLFRSAGEGTASPAPAPTRSRVAEPAKFAGAYRAASGETFEIVAAGTDQIALRRNGRDSRMQALAPPYFVCEDERFAATGLLFELEEEDIVRAWADDTEFVRAPRSDYQAPPPPELQRLAGIYDNDDRWSGPLWIIARSGKLWLNNSEPLTLLDDGSFRAGADDWSPERIRFRGFVGGRPTGLTLSGAPFVRRFS
ncbi:MAG: serine hydrolase domain-containing protein [Hyphomonadaceae bacterium]